jgi:hypothetical protein
MPGDAISSAPLCLDSHLLGSESLDYARIPSTVYKVADSSLQTSWQYTLVIGNCVLTTPADVARFTIEHRSKHLFLFKRYMRSMGEWQFYQLY